MRCRVCARPAGWLRRRCGACGRLWRVYAEHPTAPMHELLAGFEGTGADEEQVRAFLAFDPDGAGAIEDRIAAEMANQLFGAFGGTRGRQSPAEAGRLRRRGAWRGFGERPPDG